MPSWLKVTVLGALLYCLIILAKKYIWKNKIHPIVSNLRVFIALAIGIGFIVLLVIMGIRDVSNIIIFGWVILISNVLKDKSKGKLWNVNWEFFCWDMLVLPLSGWVCFKIIPTFAEIFKSFNATLPAPTAFLISNKISIFLIVLLWTIFLVLKEFNKNKKLCLIINIASFIIFYPVSIGIIVMSMFLPLFS